jgi:hypothetical protein
MKSFFNKEGLEYNGFIYIWFDIKNEKFYIGSHLGSEEDSYIGSGFEFKKEYKNRSCDFIRNILEYCLVDEYKKLRMIEEQYLRKYDVEKNPNFYNKTNSAYGGYHELIVKKRKETLNENGENCFQIAAKKMVATRMKKKSYISAKVKEIETKKEKMVDISKKISDTLKHSKWMNDGKIQKYVKSFEIEEYLNNGWLFGMIYKKPSNKNMIGINKDGVKKYIDKKDLNIYLNDGWLLGIPPTTKNYKWFFKDGEKKFISPKKFEEYIKNGWKAKY